MTDQHSSETPSTYPTAKGLCGLLVVGDWLVDENCVVGEHRAMSSSRTGLHHTRALHSDTCSVKSLCGAGQVATILHQANTEPPLPIQIHGIGLWHPDDTALLTDMIEPRNNIGITPHRLSRPDSKIIVERVRLYNIATQSTSFPVGTTQVFRTYEQVGDNLELIERVDWELPFSATNQAALHKEIGEKLANVGPDPAAVTDIVIKDLRKGVISRTLITRLAKKYPDASWHVSTKAWWPEWFQDLPKDKVRLLLIPQLAASAAIRTDDVSLSSWTTSAGQVSYDALKRMNELGNEYLNALIVVLPHSLTCLARRPSNDDSSALKGYLHWERWPSNLHRFVPMASVFFPCLIIKMLQETDRCYVEHLSTAIKTTKEWMMLEQKRLTEYDWQPSEHHRPHFEAGKTSPTLLAKSESFDWDTATATWKSAFGDIGVVQVADTSSGASKEEFHLWRAMTDVDGYVCCIRSRRKVLQVLLAQGRGFGPRGRRHHKSFMLIDSPGSGKSFLVKRLAKAMGMRMLEFNITQMLNRNDLLYCFDTIVTTQAQNPDEALLVFVDEINAKVDGQHVYDSFLAPLQDGIYIRSGNKFHIEPCFWVFAGTEEPVPRTLGAAHDKSDKGSDFESRLTLRPFHLKLNTKKHEEVSSAQMEKAYVGVAAIKAAFPDVREVSKKVLKAFKMLPTDMGPREIAHFVKEFEFIQYGRITSANMPKDWCRPLDSDAHISNQWSKLDGENEETSLVEIRSESINEV